MGFSHCYNMKCQKMRRQSVSTGLNNIRLPVTLGLAGFRHQSLFRQRCIVPTTTINWNDLEYLLDDYFPNLIFYPPNNAGNLDILNYVESTGGKYHLNLDKMSKSKFFAHLFHEDFAAFWDEAAARKKYGRPDVIRFSIDFENGKFLNEFYKLKHADMVKIDVNFVPNMFLDELGYNDAKILVWEKWDFSKIVKHKSPDIYKAFERYAHKIYTLLGFGLWKLYKENRKTLKDRNAVDLLQAGKKLLDGVVREELPKIDSLSTERRIAILELEQEILESFQKAGKKNV